MCEAARKSPGLTETEASNHVRIAKAIATSSIRVRYTELAPDRFKGFWRD